MRADVTSRLKPDGYGLCECDHDRCLLTDGESFSRREGRLRKPRRDGSRHVYDCKCPSCTGKRSREKGDKKAARARKALHISGENSRHEEVLGGALRVEFKAGGQIAPAYSAFVRCEQQSEAARPVGDTRPFAAIFLPDGSTDGVLTCRLSDAFEVAAAILENQASA